MRTSVQWKTLWARVAFAVAVAAIFMRFGNGLSDDRLHTIATVITGVSGTLLGFLITAIALLTAVMDRTLVANMRKTGHYQRFVTDTLFTCVGLLALTVTCIVNLFVAGSWLFWCFSLAIFIAAFTLCYVWEAGQRFATIVTTLD